MHTNLFLGDEINRTSPKTQSALLEAMEEGSVTVDGVTYQLPKPFICIATQNPVGMSGTQPLPEAQLDRFMIRLSIGYPGTEDQIRILDEKRSQNTMEDVHAVVTRDMVLEVQNYLSAIRMTQDILRYMTILCEHTREDAGVELGVSPRGSLLCRVCGPAGAPWRTGLCDPGGCAGGLSGRVCSPRDPEASGPDGRADRGGAS